MKIAVFLLAIAALSYTTADVLPEIYDAPEVELMSTESQVQSLMATVSKHAAIMDESSKTKAYVHNFRSTQAAIRAALKTLNDELLAGHRHDESVLKNSRAKHVNAVSGTVGAVQEQGEGLQAQRLPHEAQ